MDMRNDQDDFELCAQIENAIYLSDLFDHERGAASAKKDHSHIFNMSKEKFMLKLKHENQKG